MFRFELSRGIWQPRCITSGMAPRFTRFAAILASAGALAILFVFLVRPWYLNWGATEEERVRPLPGDAIISTAGSQNTRAITIAAPVDRVWPWLAQLGQDRGGFYSFDLVENLVGCEMPTTDVLQPERQAWYPYERLWMYPPSKAGGIGFATLRALEPGRALGFGTRLVGTDLLAPEDGSWSFALEPRQNGTTRLLIRGRGEARRSWFGVAFDRTIFEPVHFVMERRMMIGLQELAETGTRSRRLNHVHVVLWTVVFAVFATALARMLFGRGWRADLALTMAAALIFQLLTLRQPTLVLGVPLTALLVIWLWQRRRLSRSVSAA